MIRLLDVQKSFAGRAVLDGLSLEIPEGQTTVILGHSGSGKSVTLKLIVGLLTPDAGRVEVDGATVHELDADALAAMRGTIGYVFQFAALFDSMTVADNLRLGLVRRGMDEREMQRRVDESLALVGLAASADRFPAELSGGMRKRAGIARAIALRPRYILYDEPTTGLDPVTSASIDQLMVRTRDLGGTGVVVTHDLRSAFTVGDRIAMLHRGRIRQVGTVAEMQASEDPVVRQFLEGRPDPAEAGV
ncbi:MAG: ATP-binding cassette domain-containing protein [Gemmatimonadota bacterium]|nr:ATP-binding cassette domain-containing protein [Gemmatimonadota bacterium]